MDQIRRKELEDAREEFIAAIDILTVCKVASRFHPERLPCWSFSESRKGSFNICYPIVFENGDQWVVRIPLVPRLAFPEEKLRAEIATMKYITERTTIPIPRIHGYSIGTNNCLGCSFLLLEFVDGATLHSVKLLDLNEQRQKHLYRQLADFYIQLERQKFDKIGALTLKDDSTGSPWVFETNRPMTVSFNDEEVAGIGVSSLLRPDQTFSSTFEYIHTLMEMVFNQFWKTKNSIYDEEDGRAGLYGFHMCRGYLMEWIDISLNKGPFILMHGDFRPPNIIIDNAEDLNIVSVVDWEWSHTVPAQMFVPPAWLTGLLIRDAFSVAQLELKIKEFQNAVRDREEELFGELERKPLSELWKSNCEIRAALLGNGLLRLDSLSDYYWQGIDGQFYGGNMTERIDAFMDADSQQSANTKLRSKLEELKQYEQELVDLGMAKMEPPPATFTEKFNAFKKLHCVSVRSASSEAQHQVRSHNTSPQKVWITTTAALALGSYFMIRIMGLHRC